MLISDKKIKPCNVNPDNMGIHLFTVFMKPTLALDYGAFQIEKENCSKVAVSKRCQLSKEWNSGM